MTLEEKLNEFKAEGKQEEKVLLVKNMLQKINILFLKLLN